MSERMKKYLVAGVDLSDLRSRVEEHVMECLRTILNEQGVAGLDENAICDIYAYTLNQLPVLYPQREAAGPDDPVRAWSIHAVVENAIQHVKAHPKKR